MLEGKILPNRHRGQSWRRMLPKVEGRERDMNSMIVDEPNAGSANTKGRRIAPALEWHRHLPAAGRFMPVRLFPIFPLFSSGLDGDYSSSSSPSPPWPMARIRWFECKLTRPMVR